MAAISGIGDIIAGIGDVQPSTLQSLHDRERLNLEEARNRRIEEFQQSNIARQMAAQQATEAYRNSLLNIQGKRLDIAATRGTRPQIVGSERDQVLVPDPTAPSGYRAEKIPGVEQKAPAYSAPGGAREKGLQAAASIMSGPFTDTEKLRRLIEAGLSATDAKTYMDVHSNAVKLSSQAEAAFKRQASGTATPEDLRTIRAYKDFIAAGSESRKVGTEQGAFNTKDFAAAVAGAIAAAQESGRLKAQELDPSVASFLGQTWAETGGMPALGMSGSIGIRRQIISEGVKYLQSNHLDSLDFAMQQLKYKASQSAISTMQKLKVNTSNYENTVNRNIPILLQQATAYNNDPIRSIADLEYRWNNDLIGDPAARVLYGTLYETLVDYSKVVTGNFGISGLTDAARTEGQKLLSVIDKPETFRAALANFQVLMHNRTAAIQNTIDDSLKGVAMTPRSSLTTTPPTTSVSPLTQPITQKERDAITNSAKFKSLPDGEPIIVRGKQIGVKRGNTIMEK